MQDISLDNPTNTLRVHMSEAGQKLLQFLVRRLGLGTSVLHKWIRTGQVRLNGKRCNAFKRIEEGDAVRLPPFALEMARSHVEFSSSSHMHMRDADHTYARGTKKTSSPRPSSTMHASSLCPLPPLVYEDTHLLVFNKCQGLAVHTGTGHTDSLATRLAHHHADAIFKPTPIHRLDKETSGIILVARSYAALRAVQESFQKRSATKHYLAWVCGTWPYHDMDYKLTHFIGKKYEGDDEKVRILSEKQGKEAVCLVTCLLRVHGASLLRIRLISGRTHQIRVQLAEAGYPLLGDKKYGGNALINSTTHEHSFYLHALRVELPRTESINALGLSEHMYSIAPAWTGRYAVKLAGEL